MIFFPYWPELPKRTKQKNVPKCGLYTNYISNWALNRRVWIETMLLLEFVCLLSLLSWISLSLYLVSYFSITRFLFSFFFFWCMTSWLLPIGILFQKLCWLARQKNVLKVVFLLFFHIFFTMQTCCRLFTWHLPIRVPQWKIEINKNDFVLEQIRQIIFSKIQGNSFWQLAVTKFT